MCGRFNIIDDPLIKFTSELLGLDFDTKSNSNVCPSDSISTVTSIDNQLVQIIANWGIKPSWAKKLLINAQSETVAVKKTFQNSYKYSRCVIPFSGWYEWKTVTSEATTNLTKKTTKKNHKKKYLFENNEQPIYMAAILFKNTVPLKAMDVFDLVTLTTAANEICKPIHHRMPLLINHSDIVDWLTKDVDEIKNMLLPDILGINVREVT